MKLLFCTKCFDIRALEPEGEWTRCRCGNLEARWVDPNRGTVSVRATNRAFARIIGMNNQMLLGAEESLNDEDWKLLHEIATDAKGYIFDKAFRGCWACIMKVGETGDISWAPEEDPGV